MTDGSEFRVDVDTRLELYLSLDPEGMHKSLFENESVEDMYAPAVGLCQVTTTRTGLREVDEEVTPLKMNMQVEPGNEVHFCWTEDVVKPLREFENWFDHESMYEDEVRGECTYTVHDVPYDVTLSKGGGATVMIDYPANEESADDYSCRVRLIYGVPWTSVEEQHPAVTVFSHEVPETVNEALGIVELAFRNDPVRDIPICLFDESSHENGTEDDTENNTDHAE